MEIRLIAAFLHDFEAERVRLEQAKETSDQGTNVKSRRMILDPRIPLSLRLQQPHIIEAWVKKANKDFDLDPPIERPKVIYEMAVPVPGMPNQT